MATTPRRRQATEEVAFRPVDNARLAALCGPLDENLRQIETALDVSISRRGERFNVAGPRQKVDQAAAALRRFYDHAGREELGIEDIQLGLIEISHTRRVPEKEPSVESPGLLLPRRSELTARTPRQAEYLQNMRNFDITFCVGPAGTGKTFLAVAAAVDALERDVVKRIVLTRPAVEAGEKLGFLPGDLAQKVDPYLRPLYDALQDLMPFEKIRRFLELGVIEIAPLAFMRGRTLTNAFVILDEAQNTTVRQMKMFLTRMGQGTRSAITGDVTQIDLANPESSGLVKVQDILNGVPDIKFIYFEKADVVRHRLVRDILQAFDDFHRTQTNPDDGSAEPHAEPKAE